MTAVGQLGLAERQHRGQQRTGARHVVLHRRVDRVTGLQADAARVVHHALADDREVCRRCDTIGRVGQLDESRWLLAAAVDGDDAAALHLDQLVAIEDLDTRARHLGPRPRRDRRSGLPTCVRAERCTGLAQPQSCGHTARRDRRWPEPQRHRAQTMVIDSTRTVLGDDLRASHLYRASTIPSTAAPATSPAFAPGRQDERQRRSVTSLHSQTVRQRRESRLHRRSANDPTPTATRNAGPCRYRQQLPGLSGRTRQRSSAALSSWSSPGTSPSSPTATPTTSASPANCRWPSPSPSRTGSEPRQSCLGSLWPVA